MHKKTLHSLIDLINAKKITAKDVYEDLLKNIKHQDKQINAYISVFDNMECENLDGFLHGLPIAIKDNMHIKGKKTTCASKMLENFTAIFDADVVARLKKAGASFIGKNNMDEFAMGSSTETSYFGVVKNPWDLSCIPGGSSGGSTAAVANGEAIAALGSDTGGSIRQPAALCGVVGFKPTYGRVSRYGLVAFASSLDQIGPITRDVKDAAILMNIISGKDEKDSTSANVDVPDYTQFLSRNIKGMKIGVYDKVLKDCSQAVVNSMEESIQTYKDLGCELESIDLPNTKYCISDYYIIAPAEASSNLSRYDGIKYGFRSSEYDGLLDMYKKTRSEGFGDEVKRRIMLGTYALSSGYYDAYYLKAQKLRNLIKQDFDSVFEKYDCIIMPTTPTEAFKIGEKTDPLQMYLSDIFTISANLTAIPAISIPNGISHNNLPTGLQILSDTFREDLIFKCAYAFEQEHSFYKKIPLS